MLTFQWSLRHVTCLVKPLGIKMHQSRMGLAQLNRSTFAFEPAWHSLFLQLSWLGLVFFRILSSVQLGKCWLIMSHFLYLKESFICLSYCKVRYVNVSKLMSGKEYLIKYKFPTLIMLDNFLKMLWLIQALIPRPLIPGPNSVYYLAIKLLIWFYQTNFP